MPEEMLVTSPYKESARSLEPIHLMNSEVLRKAFQRSGLGIGTRGQAINEKTISHFRLNSQTCIDFEKEM